MTGRSRGLTRPYETVYPCSEQGEPIPTPSDYGARRHRLRVTSPWEDEHSDADTTAPTAALRQPSLSPAETRTLARIIGEDFRQKDAWGRHWESPSQELPNIDPPPTGTLLIPIRYLDPRNPRDSYTVEAGTCQVTLDVWPIHCSASKKTSTDELWDDILS